MNFRRTACPDPLPLQTRVVQAPHNPAHCLDLFPVHPVSDEGVCLAGMMDVNAM